MLTRRMASKLVVAVMAAGLAVGVGVGAGCNKKADEATIRVGHYGSMTGSKANFGRSTDNAIKMAVDEINAAGGVDVGGTKKKLVLTTLDTEGKPEKAGPVVTRLVTQDKVNAIIGEVASGITMAGAPVAQKYGIPMITPSSTNEAVTEIGDFISRVCFIDPLQGYACAVFAKDHLKVTKVGVLYDKSAPYSVGLRAEFVKAFTAGGAGTIVGEGVFKEGDTDFRAQLTQLREAKPEAIFVPGYYAEMTNIAIQGRELGITVPFIGGDGWDGPDLPRNAGKAIEGSYYSNHYAADQEGDKVKDFVRKYGEKYKDADGKPTVPDGLAALGYDATYLLADAIKRAGSLEGAKVRDAINATKNFPGVTGTITINEKRDAVKPVVIVKYDGGVPRYVTTVQPPK